VRYRSRVRELRSDPCLRPIIDELIENAEREGIFIDDDEFVTLEFKIEGDQTTISLAPIYVTTV
jgi:hypothetical protein